MNTNPINLGVRFLLEIIMLIVLGYWGWHLVGWIHYLAVIFIPLAAAILWAVFRIPNDPKAAPVKIPSILRLLLEVVLFGSAIWALADLNQPKLSLALVIVVTIHYLVSYDRTWPMLKNKPYKGFEGRF